MKRWGVAISLLYALVVIGLLVPAAIVLVGEDRLFTSEFFDHWKAVYKEWSVWVVAGTLIVSQIALLFLSVDLSFKHLKPRTHILVTCAMAGLLFALLTFAGVFSLDAAAKLGIDNAVGSWPLAFAFCCALWVLWAGVFYLYLRGSSEAVTRALTWLLRGSVLELLIAVPSHVIVRRRDECCAPILTSFGIVTGIAVMLLSFGPGILLLYKKRIESYRNRPVLTGTRM